MCRETIEVKGLSNARTAYEVEQYLLGLQHVEDVNADFINGVVVVEYDENEVNYGTVLDKIEYSGCVPSERIDGILDQLKVKLTGVRKI